MAEDCTTSKGLYFDVLKDFRTVSAFRETAAEQAIPVQEVTTFEDRVII